MSSSGAYLTASRFHGIDFYLKTPRLCRAHVPLLYSGACSFFGLPGGTLDGNQGRPCSLQIFRFGERRMHRNTMQPIGCGFVPYIIRVGVVPERISLGLEGRGLS